MESEGTVFKEFQAEKGKLYIVPTPIGNLGDISFRAANLLKTCDAIACETPSVTRKLLQALNIPSKPLYTYRDAGENKTATWLVEKLKDGCSLVLLSDAGTPTLSDPGFRLVYLCRQQGIPIIALPGPCAAITALSASGLPTDKFAFLGFLSPKLGTRTHFLEAYKEWDGTLIIYESPFRLAALLSLLKDIFEPWRLVCVAHELTKIHESYCCGKIDDVIKQMGTGAKIKGEYVVLVASESFSRKLKENAE